MLRRPLRIRNTLTDLVCCTSPGATYYPLIFVPRNSQHMPHRPNNDVPLSTVKESPVLQKEGFTENAFEKAGTPVPTMEGRSSSHMMSLSSRSQYFVRRMDVRQAKVAANQECRPWRSQVRDRADSSRAQREVLRMSIALC